MGDHRTPGMGNVHIQSLQPENKRWLHVPYVYNIEYKGGGGGFSTNTPTVTNIRQR